MLLINETSPSYLGLAYITSPRATYEREFKLLPYVIYICYPVCSLPEREASPRDSDPLYRGKPQEGAGGQADQKANIKG